MSHKRTPGRLFVTHIGVSGNETLIQLSKASELQFDNELPEITDVGDNGWKAYDDGLRAWSAPGEINYDQKDAEMADLIDKLIDPSISTTKNVIIGQQAAIGDIAWLGKVRISNVNISSPVSGIVSMKFQMQGNLNLAKITYDQYDQYDYYTSDPQFNEYSGVGVAKTYYDGSTYVRKVIKTNLYKKQISIDGVNWTDIDPQDTITGTQVRNGVSGGEWYVDFWDGVTWQHIEGPASAGGTGQFRDGVRDNAYVVDEALTPTAWSGVEGVDWKNIQKNSLT